MRKSKFIGKTFTRFGSFSKKQHYLKIESHPTFINHVYFTPLQSTEERYLVQVGSIRSALKGWKQTEIS